LFFFVFFCFLVRSKTKPLPQNGRKTLNTIIQCVSQLQLE
jgi:hypothetical protein